MEVINLTRDIGVHVKKTTKIATNKITGGEVVFYNYLLTKKATGLRINVARLKGTDNYIVSLINGKNKTTSFREYKRIPLKSPTYEHINEAVKGLMPLALNILECEITLGRIKE